MCYLSDAGRLRASCFHLRRAGSAKRWHACLALAWAACDGSRAAQTILCSGRCRKTQQLGRKVGCESGASEHGMKTSWASLHARCQPQQVYAQPGTNRQGLGPARRACICNCPLPAKTSARSCSAGLASVQMHSCQPPQADMPSLQLSSMYATAHCQLPRAHRYLIVQLRIVQLLRVRAVGFAGDTDRQ